MKLWTSTLAAGAILAFAAPAGYAATSNLPSDYGSTAAHGPFVHVDVRGRLARWRG